MHTLPVENRVQVFFRETALAEQHCLRDLDGDANEKGSQ